MIKYTEHFENELGNPIEVSITSSKDGFEITYTLVGPKSMIENTITRSEAEFLYHLLGKSLGKP